MFFMLGFVDENISLFFIEMMHVMLLMLLFTVYVTRNGEEESVIQKAHEDRITEIKIINPC